MSRNLLRKPNHTRGEVEMVLSRRLRPLPIGRSIELAEDGTLITEEPRQVITTNR